MRPSTKKLLLEGLIALFVAAIVGLAGRASALAGRVTSLEVRLDAMASSVEVIREDVRELRRKLLGDVP